MKKYFIALFLVTFLFIDQFFEASSGTGTLFEEGTSTVEIAAFTDSLLNIFYSKAALKVDAILKPYAWKRSPGLAVGVIQDGKIVYEKGFGLANLRTKQPIRANIPFLLASISKQFTAMAIMILKEEGKLTYSDSITQYFSGLPKLWRKITIKQLLTHKSGIPDRFKYIGYAEGYTNKDILDKLISNRGLSFRPGRRFKYSNSGYNLLAMIVEKVSGKSFREFVHERIFAPLGMYHSYVYDETKPEIPNRAIAYRPIRRGRFIPNDLLLYTTGASGIYSTVEDLYKWDQALYTEKLVSLETLEEAFEPHARVSRRENYGFGWRLSADKNLKIVYHTGSLGGIRNIFVRIPDENISVIILANNRLRSRKWLVRRIIEQYRPGLLHDVVF